VRDLGECIQIRPAVRVDDTLGAAGRAARVVDADLVVLGLEPIIRFAGGGVRKEPLVLAAGPGHEHAFDASTLDEVHETRIDDDESRARVLEDVADLVRGESRVDGDEHAACRGHAVVGLE